MNRWYRFDWQYAVDMSRLPVLRAASVLISVTPLILDAAALLHVRLVNLQLSWIAAVCFLLAWVWLNLACPKFILEYRDYGEYLNRHHSHRWIAWEFYSNIKTLSAWATVARETIAKGLTTSADRLDPVIVGKLVYPVSATTPKGDPRLELPVNIDRDIYVPILLDGKRYALALRESDPELAAKEKELFWILYSESAKERPIRRIVFWMLFAAAALVFAANVIIRVAAVLT